MNLDAVKSKLDRLNRFYEFMASNPNDISSLDRDSFLMQLRELYALVLEEEEAKSDLESKETRKTEEPIEEPKKKPLKKSAKFVFNTAKKEEKTETVVEKKEPKAEKLEPVEPKVETPKPVEEKKVTVVPKEKLEEVKEEPKVEEKKEEAPKIESKKEKPKEDPKEVALEEAFNEDFEELFVHKQATDLAAKLSESPIKDLNEKLGLNEKFHYINELFGGDVAKFKESIDFLNTAEHFDQARRFMEKELVDQFNWMKKMKKSLAKDFVKLVRRRYM